MYDKSFKLLQLLVWRANPDMWKALYATELGVRHKTTPKEIESLLAALHGIRVTP